LSTSQVLVTRNITWSFSRITFAPTRAVEPFGLTRLLIDVTGTKNPT